MKKPIGHLERVDPATVWKSEPGDFVPWLAAEENLRRLGQALCVDLELVARETRIGRYRADLLCRDRATGGTVVIEVQLGASDHAHLGQILTYALRLPACAVWLATRFHREHREVVEELNRLGGAAFPCFAVAMDVWEIAGSPVAPQFNVLAGPEDWAAAADGAHADRISEAGAERLPRGPSSRPVFGENPIRVHRRRRGMTVKQLAKAAGISRAYLSHIETGRYWGSPETRAALASALDLPPGALN